MKIVGKDNYDRETVADTLLVSGIPDTEENKVKAQETCDWLNTLGHDYYYEVRENSDRLWRGMEELV